MIPKKLQQKLNERTANNALRQLGNTNNLVDFSSNDYLGFSKNETIFNETHQYLIDNTITQNGATGSRLLSGNHQLYNSVEATIAKLHNSEAALIFNSGYDANLGFFSSVPQRGDIIFYDEFAHASIRDGIKMSNAKAYKFKHNNLDNLANQLERNHDTVKGNEIYIVTESVFSMDGDTPNLKALVQLCKQYHCHLIIDEAHAIGVFGNNGLGLTQDLSPAIFARIITFGKAMGCHGAAILGSEKLKEYLVNFSRSFIYTTGLPPHSLATIKITYNTLVSQSLLAAHKTANKTSQIEKLKQNISFFKSETKRLQINQTFINSDSAIHCCIITGNENVKRVANYLQKNNFNVKPILSPTVAKGEERLRFCLHAYNSKAEITKVLQLLANFVTHE